MSNKPNIALLCNNKMALPAMQLMYDAGVLCCIATTDRDTEVVVLFRSKAAEYNVPYTIIRHKNYQQELQAWLKNTQPDSMFVMTFPWRIPGAVLNMPPMGVYNFHYGLLPEMRGADPIFESIRQGRSYAGTTVHVMNEDFDAGAIVLKEQILLPAEYTYGMLSSQMAYIGAQLCTQLINILQEGKDVPAIMQDETIARYWPRVEEAELWINWDDMDSKTIAALVRSCNPIAKGAPAMVNNWKIGVCDVSDVNLQGDASAIVPGTILALDVQNGLIVCCRDGKALKLDVIYTAEGVFPGYKLAFFGVTSGMVFTSAPTKQTLNYVDNK